MNDKCEVVYLDPARRDQRKIGKKSPGDIPFIENAVKEVEDNGWKMATGSRLIRPLRNKKQIGEIRDMQGDYRLILFWHDDGSTRYLFVTAVVTKEEVEDRSRLNTFIEAAIKRRNQFLKEQG
jgi:mRNA-degrading endonuclease RelE of RelBE toxin-antitoxin system